MSESLWEPIDTQKFEQLWRAEEADATGRRERTRLYLTAGLLLPVWNKLGCELIHVARIVANDGRALIGRQVDAADIPAISEAFGLTQTHVFPVQNIAASVLSNGKPLPLASHDALIVKRSLVNGSQRIELVGFSPQRLDWYKSKGCFTEIIRYRTRLFVPTPDAVSILANLAV